MVLEPERVFKWDNGLAWFEAGIFYPSANVALSPPPPLDSVFLPFLINTLLILWIKLTDRTFSHQREILVKLESNVADLKAKQKSPNPVI